jgi:hypothetical protein
MTSPTNFFDEGAREETLKAVGSLQSPAKRSDTTQEKIKANQRRAETTF